jgi:hypothetical protein
MSRRCRLPTSRVLGAAASKAPPAPPRDTLRARLAEREAQVAEPRPDGAEFADWVRCCFGAC